MTGVLIRGGMDTQRDTRDEAIQTKEHVRTQQKSGVYKQMRERPQKKPNLLTL